MTIKSVQLYVGDYQEHDGIRNGFRYKKNTIKSYDKPKQDNGFN